MSFSKIDGESGAVSPCSVECQRLFAEEEPDPGLPSTYPPRISLSANCDSELV
jgi:hypothetical protein